MLGMYTGILPARTTPPVRICQYWGVSRREAVRNYKELGPGRGKGRIYNECFGPDEPRAGSRAIPLPPSLALPFAHVRARAPRTPGGHAKCAREPAFPSEIRSSACSVASTEASWCRRRRRCRGRR